MAGLSVVGLVAVTAAPAGALSPPGPPSAVSVTVGTTSVSVAFVEPASDGGSPITGYTARCTSSTGGLTRWATAPAGPITVTGLTGMATNTCQVRAANASGSSAWSAPSDPFVAPASVPGAPLDVAATVTAAAPACW